MTSRHVDGGIMSFVRFAVLVAVVMAGCAAKPAEPLVNPKPRIQRNPPIEWRTASQRPPARRPEKVAADRPELDLAHLKPDPEHDMRWPLTVSVHPMLEPSFAIAQELAEPGIGWIDLCRMGAKNRYGGNKLRDLTMYLRAWCAIEGGDVDGGLAELVSLQSSVTRGLGPAVRLDIISVLAAGDANQAEKLMNKHKLLTLERLDLLAGTYVELGKPDDAYAINLRALQSDRVASRASSCRRLARSIVLGGSDVRDAPLEELRVHASQDKPEPMCVDLHRELECWVFMSRTSITSIAATFTRCGPYWTHQGLPEEQRAFLEAYFGWPSRAGGEVWLQIGESAAQSLTLPGADHVAVRALEAAIEAERCTGQLTAQASALANRILHEPTRVKTVDDARLTRLIDRPLELCSLRTIQP